MTCNFCTLFDSNYYSRGLVLYKSLLKLDFNFHLYVFAFDDECYNLLNNQNLIHLTVISLNNFEDVELLNIKNSRNKAEYCWTSTPCTILYCIQKYNLSECTYLDADLYFFNTPEELFEEIGNSSIALTKHNYTKKYDQSNTSGIYCVQFVYFKNDKIGMTALKWWRDRCIEWCYARLENGKFGDQKYLDDWPTRFENVHVIQNLGAGVAPWNIQQYLFINNFQFIEKNDHTSKVNSIIFYHFHYLNYFIFENTINVSPSKFRLNNFVEQILYVPYINSLILEESNNIQKNSINNIIFIKNTIFQTLLNWSRLKFKKVNLFRKINSLINRSSR
jgi:hypothetical protein